MSKRQKGILETMRTNARNYDERKRQLEEKLYVERGIKLDSFGVDKDFPYDELGASEKRFLQGSSGSSNYSMPFSDAQIDKFLSCKKARFGSPKLVSNKGKHIHGMYLYADIDGQDTVFAFSVVRNAKEAYAYKSFTMKLDVLVAGKEWYEIVRLDSCNEDHPNYIELDPDSNSYKVASENNLEYIQEGTPHVHKNSEFVRVVADTVSYTPATPAPDRILSQLNSNDNSFFSSALDFMLGQCGMDRNLLERTNPDNIMDEHTSLFDFEMGGL